MSREPALRGITNRLLQAAARSLPGAMSLRPSLHRLRGVTIGQGTFIGTDAIIETSNPQLVSIGSGVAIGIRTTIVAHFRGSLPVRHTVVIEDDAFIGPGVIVLPNVTIGRGAVVMAGSVVAASVPPMTVVQGNPARPIATCGVPLGMSTPIKEFYRHLRPLRKH